MKMVSTTWKQCQQHEHNVSSMKTVSTTWKRWTVIESKIRNPSHPPPAFLRYCAQKRKRFPLQPSHSLRSPSHCKLQASLDSVRTHKEKILSHKIILQCCAHPLEQVARHTLQNTNHFIFSAAAEITDFSSCLSPSLSPFLYHLHQAQRACGCLHGVKLSYTSGHRRWLWHENTQTVKSKSAYFNETITQKICPHF